MLDELAREKKRAIVSCASGSKVVSFVNGVLVVVFKVAFQCDRMNKDDYRNTIEAILLKHARMSIRLQCVQEGKFKPTAKMQKPIAPVIATKPLEKETKVEMPQSASQEQLPENLQKLEQLFGGKLNKA